MPDQDLRHRPGGPAESDALPLRGREREDVEDLSPPRVALVYQVLLREGEEQHGRPSLALVWSGLAAGLSMGLSMAADGVIRSALPDAEWARLVSSFGYAAGFLVVILGRQQLFTESTLVAVLPMLDRRTLVGHRDVVRLWGLVLAANLAGTFAFAAWVHGTEVFGSGAAAAFTELGSHAVERGASLNFAKAIVAGWVIASLVWLLPSSGVARPLLILLLTWFVAAAELSHIVAGATEASFAVFAGVVPWTTMVGNFLLPTLAGNIVGGVGLVALMTYAQIRADAATGVTRH
jgi:formate/nitrite transporter FocA (FNT family)